MHGPMIDVEGADNRYRPIIEDLRYTCQLGPGRLVNSAVVNVIGIYCSHDIVLLH